MRLVIDPHLHFGDDPEQDKEHARQTDRRGEQRQRRLNQGDVPGIFEDQRPAQDGDREDKKTEAELAEELDRPVKRPVDKVDDQQIEQDAGDAADPVLRFTEPARVVADSDLGDACPFPGGVDRDETVHLAVETHVFEDLPPVGLERAAESCSGTWSRAEISQLATIEGSRRVSAFSSRATRQPETTSKPSASLARSRGMSAGSFWPSPSIGMTTSPLLF